LFPECVSFFELFFVPPTIAKMQGIMSYLLGGEPSSPPASRAAEQEEINIAMALSLSEPAPSETPLQDDSQVETENDQAIAKALATTVEINSIPTTPTEKPELPIMAIHRNT